MKLTITLAQVILGFAVWGGVAVAAGPAVGNGPWVLCPNNSSVCAAQLGPDLDTTNENFDCLTRNGSPGHALQNANTGTARCWAFVGAPSGS